MISYERKLLCTSMFLCPKTEQNNITNKGLKSVADSIVQAKIRSLRQRKTGKGQNES